MSPFFNLLVALLLIFVHDANCQDELIQTPEEVALMDHLIENGSMFKLKTGKKCPTCIRGAFATEDISRGDLIAAMPLPLGVPLLLGYHGFPGEYAHEMVQRMMLDPEFNKTYGVYWDTLPKKGEILASETITEELLDLLQTPKLENLYRGQRDVSEAAYYGQTEGFQPIPKLLTGDAAMDISDFLHIAAIIGTRDFTLEADIPVNVTVRTLEGKYEQQDVRSWLLPVIDIINHHHNANAHRGNNETHILETALRDIKKGEEITNNYQWMVLHRNDMSLCVYGFILDENLDLMLTTDLPAYQHEHPWEPTALDDEHYYGPDGHFSSIEELERLDGLLKQAESITTAEQDAKLLEEIEAKGGYDWKEHMIIKFRLGRKRALRKAMRMVESALKEEQKNNEQGDESNDNKDEL